MPLSILLAQGALLARLAVPYPFAVGETLRYEARFGMFPIGTATVSVSGVTDTRGDETFVFRTTGGGGPPGFRLDYDMTSWVGTHEFTSRRFHRKVVENGKPETRHYEILPDSGRYRIEGRPQEWKTPRDALDELALLYYLRTAPLQVGKTYTLERYFQTGYNPVTVQVAGREVVTLATGQALPCLMLNLAAAGATGQVWLTDDARRLPAQLRLPLPMGWVTLQLSEMPAAQYRPK